MTHMRKLPLIQCGYIFGGENIENKTENNLGYVMENTLNFFKIFLRKNKRFEVGKWQLNPVFLSENFSSNMVDGLKRSVNEIIESLRQSCWDN